MIHARDDYNRIQDPAGKIPADEPVFLLRAQDDLAYKAVEYYAFLCGKAQAPEVAAKAWEQADRMATWPKKKAPDLPTDAQIAATQQATEPVGAIQRVRKALADRKFREAADTEDLLRMAANVIAEDGTILKHMEGKQAAEPTDEQIAATAGRMGLFSQSRPLGQQWENIYSLVRRVIAERVTAPTQQPLTSWQRRQIIMRVKTVGEAIDMVEAIHNITRPTIPAPQLEATQQAAEPNAVLVEGFGRVAMRKLNDLREKGYAINGVSIATISEAGETQLGAVTTGGRVLWWPQQAAEPVGVVESAIPGAGGFHVRLADGAIMPAVGTELYNKAPTQEPMTIPEGYMVVPVDRSYDMRVQAMLHFNTAHKAGADRDDCLEAAWRATLAAAHGITGSKT